MKRFCFTFALFIACSVCYGQYVIREKHGKVLFPRVVMENGTVVETSVVNGSQVVLDINGNENNESLMVSIEKDGVVLDALVTRMENDCIVVDTDVEIDGKCTIVLRTEEDTVEVAESEEVEE